MPSYSIGCSWFDAAYSCYASHHSRTPTIMRSSSMSSSMLSTNVGPGENSELRSSPDSDRGDVGDATDVGEPGACGEAEVEEDKSAVESRADAVNETVNETVKETAKETGTETGTETVKDTPEKPRAASMLELSTGLPREEAAALRTPNQSVSGLEEPSTPKGPAPPTLPPLSQLAMLPPVSTPVREYHAVISHKHVASGLSVRSRESGTLSPSVTMQQVQSPGRASAHAFSGEEPGTPSVAGEGYAPSEGGSYHSVILTSDGVVTPGAEGAAKREWGQEKLDIVFDGDEKAGEHEVEPVETVATR